ncbi:acyl-CoA thioesterase [Undibacterium sp. TS12]|uniref:acyl-CoA thioesterase n=1 Tax=Undibacterium sp. TS12 TaxID=2908202 RepID=UPI001F4C596A|nr:acyl-CoA thioesterase [Undibacterium sp. TS12]MCH8618178.1 acyl-CoA thioesterase [Undibacterium sp. TS12]
MEKNYYDTSIEVKYRDTDSVGNLSSTVYYDYLQHAYLRYMFDLLELPREEKLPHIMVKTECEYVMPAKFGDVLTIKSGVTKFGTKSFEIEHLMYKNAVGEGEAKLVAKGTSKHVMFDYEKNQSVVVPEEFKKRVLDFQERA